jgi:hypothetical protein
MIFSFIFDINNMNKLFSILILYYYFHKIDKENIISKKKFFNSI